MNIISTGIASKKRVLLSRQHCDVKKGDLETGLSNFNRLLEKQKGDHTFVETEKCRFVYQPVDEYYVFVMTSLDSNIVRDIGVVKTLAEILQVVVQPKINEEAIQENLFELIFYMDELISNNKPEDLTLDQIKEYILMDSQEEKKHNMIQTTKEKEEKERRKQIAAKLEKRKQLDHNFMDSITEMPAFTAQPVDEYKSAAPMSETVTTPSGMRLSIQRPTTGMSPLGLNAMRHSPAPRSARDEESINILDAEAPAVIQIIESCSGNIHLEGDIDVLNIQGELVMTAFEDSARSAALEVSGNSEIKMRYHPSLDKQMASKNIIEQQSAQQTYNIGHSTALVKWRHKTSEEQYFPISLSCWPNTNAGETTVTVEMQNNSGSVLEALNFEIMDSRYNQIVVHTNELGGVERKPDAVTWVGKLEFTTKGDLNSILPFTLVAKASTSITHFKRCRTRGEDTDFVLGYNWERGHLMTCFSILIVFISVIPYCTGLRLRKCYIERPHLPGRNVEIRWKDRQGTNKPHKEYYYVCQDGEVRIPQVARKRAFTCNLLKAATAKAGYADPADILNRLEAIAEHQDFETVKSLFLDIFRWFAFKKIEFINHPHFTSIRKRFLETHFFFGRVYSRVLKSHFKFSRCYPDLSHLSLANRYVRWMNGGIPLEEQCITFLINKSCVRAHPLLIDRIAALVNLHDSVDALNAIFTDVRGNSNDLILSTRIANRHPVNSEAALWLHRWLDAAQDARTTRQLQTITKLQIYDSDDLEGDYVQSGDRTGHAPDAPVSCVPAAFEQIYKLFQRLDCLQGNKKDEHKTPMLNGNATLSRDELFSINMLCKLKQFEAQRDVGDLLHGLFSMIRYLNTKVNEGPSMHERSDFILAFKHHVCVPYLRCVMRASTYALSSLLRMKGVLDLLESGKKRHRYAPYCSESTLRSFMYYGMNRFCSMFNYTGTPRNKANDIFGILTKDSYYYLYRDSDDKIVASNNAPAMDLWNIGKRSHLSGPLQCQLVIRSYKVCIEDDIQQMIEKAKANLSAKIGVELEFDNIVNLHFPRYVNVTPMRAFDPTLLQERNSGLIEHPIHRFISILNS
ncbi:coatamer delta subunit containing protein,putative [Babesia bigemina]|uniref:Coatomer subunit delta n=1 Tax=Babesia bigemina TaxID=5866 RepID=A0A061D2N5_BABBI|nr:coatamer delta subunit containing protein,putative [Babesia bigemina]CDR95041.1 coatamer delta subunit containing protein,putative [Babesia bigemina]|eukprot:XP_012767227.1 coatamer delta subunit containing protein,putative [Babesia bigemina]